MTRGQKAGYIFRESTIAWFLFCGMLFFVGLAFVQDRDTWQEKLITTTVIVGITLLLLLPSTLGKWIAIRRSKARVAETIQSDRDKKLVASSSL